MKFFKYINGHPSQSPHILPHLLGRPCKSNPAKLLRNRTYYDYDVDFHNDFQNHDIHSIGACSEIRWVLFMH